MKSGSPLISTYPTERWKYTSTAQFLHWILAILIVGMIGLGWYMMSIEKQPNSDSYFNLHKSIGLIVASLVIMRLIWRAFHRRAPLPFTVEGWQVTLAALTQVMLYVGMIVMPATGIAGVAFSKDGLAFFGMALPKFVSPDHAISELLFNVHGAAVWILVFLILLHVAGALKHLILDRDGVFQRMLP